MQVRLNDKIIDVIIERKNNKNMYIRFKDDLRMYVTCNRYVSEGEISKVIKDNSKSLSKMYDKQVKLKDNDNFYYYLGDKYTVVFDATINRYSISEGLITVKNQKMLDKFYEDECKRVFLEQVNKCMLMFTGLPSFKVKIRKMKTRWGVCNRGNNTVTLNSELIKKEMTLIDYVIIHELCHFYQANHSNLFWLEVSKRYPYYKEARKMLRSA